MEFVSVTKQPCAGPVSSGYRASVGVSLISAPQFSMFPILRFYPFFSTPLETTGKNSNIFRLTTLWALAESGLGGWMHALHLPFTGFFVGAFAVILICLIARYSGNSFRQVVQATVLVLMVKAAVSPQSPPPAYLAVAFQGLLGAVLFSIVPSFRAAAILLGVLAMVESALQKIIVATLIFGNSLWEAVDKFFAGILKELHLPADTSFSLWIIVTYTLAYAAWGLILGWWIGRLPERIEQRAASILEELKEDRESTTTPPVSPARQPWKKLLGYLLVLAFILFVLFSDSVLSSRALYIILRTLAVLSFLVFILNPFLKWLIRRRLERASGKRQTAMQEILVLLPELRKWIKPAYTLARKKKGLRRFSRFVLVFLVISLYPDKLEQQ